ncbi:MAG: oligosaccharide flippase family protein [Candidatus Krumholzibacteria bacterium]|nr:oligosaccharide flippase family protein [Candidatus Krumholzibacteria bacterium]MDH4336395.1 oligosaccharide flippase family protein [Candidatus Krumholzibacteria bacterium]MDH5269520.1 oligosaccharide flippase family protein [Candidatus Krumholzibacteria bacterium]
MEGTARRIGNAMAWSVAARGIRFLLGLVSSVVVVRGLGQHDYGVLSVVRSVLMFVIMLAGAGTGQALLKFLPAMRVVGSGVAARRLLRRVVLVHLTGWCVLVVVALAARHGTERLFHVDGIGVVVVAAVALALFEILFTLAGQVLNASFEARRLAFASTASHTVYLGVLLVSLRGGLGVIDVLVAAAAGSAVACAIVAGRLRPSVDYGNAAGGEFGPGRILRYSAPFAAIGILNLVVWRQSEVLLLGHFRSPEETGYFDLAYRLPQTILEFVPGTVWPLVMAGMSEAFARDRTSIRRAVDRYYRMLFVLCAPICAMGAVLAPRAVAVMFGEDMMPAAVPMQLFFLILTVSFLSTPLSMSLYVLEKTHINLVIYGALTVINLGLDLLLIPKYGVFGAVVPVAIAIALQPLAYYLAARREIAGIGIPFAFIGRCFLASAAVVVALPVLHLFPGVPGLAAAGVVAGVAVVFAYREAGVLGGDEIDAVGAIPLPGSARLAAFFRK